MFRSIEMSASADDLSWFIVDLRYVFIGGTTVGLWVKAKRETYGTTGHAHINTAYIIVSPYSNNYYFCFHYCKGKVYGWGRCRR